MWHLMYTATCFDCDGREVDVSSQLTTATWLIVRMFWKTFFSFSFTMCCVLGSLSLCISCRLFCYFLLVVFSVRIVGLKKLGNVFLNQSVQSHVKVYVNGVRSLVWWHHTERCNRFVGYNVYRKINTCIHVVLHISSGVFGGGGFRHAPSLVAILYM